MCNSVTIFLNISTYTDGIRQNGGTLSQMRKRLKFVFYEFSFSLIYAVSSDMRHAKDPD